MEVPAISVATQKRMNCFFINNFSLILSSAIGTRRDFSDQRQWFYQLPSYFVKSAAVGGPSTQLMSHAPSTVMNVSEFAGSHASSIILAGMKLKPPGLTSNYLPSHHTLARPLLIVCESLAVHQCLRIEIALHDRI